MDNLQKYRVREWNEVQGDSNLRVQYPLNQNSVVFDVGGYEGEWAHQIFNKYGSNIFIFEPIEEFYLKIKSRFSQNPKIRVFNFGLGSKSEEIQFFLDLDGTSSFGETEVKTPKTSKNGKIVRFKDFIEEKNIKSIDLIKINIEGGEFDLVPEIMSSSINNSINDIQVQFHSFVPDAERKMKEIYQALSQSRYLTYSFDFVWDNWRLTSTSNRDDILAVCKSYAERIKKIERYEVQQANQKETEILSFKNEIARLNSLISEYDEKIEHIEKIKSTLLFKFYQLLKRAFSIK